MTRLNIEETSVEQWDRIMAVNARGVFLGTKHCLPAMRRTRGGGIIDISSTAGIVGAASSSCVCRKQGGSSAFTKATAVQYAKDKIRGDSVHPGPILTEMNRLLFEGSPGARAAAEGLIRLNRLGGPRDITYGVLNLASDDEASGTGEPRGSQL